MGETIAFWLLAGAAGSGAPVGGPTAAGAADGRPMAGAGPRTNAPAPPSEGVAEMRTERPPELSSSSPMPVRWTSRMSRLSSWNWKPATASFVGAAGLASGPAAGAPAFRAGVAARARFLRSVPRGMSPQALDQPAEGQPVALRAEPRHARHHHARHQRVMTERFPCARVRHVHLDRREACARDRIANRDARVREAARVE